MSLQSDVKSKDMVRNLNVTLNQIEPLFVLRTVVCLPQS